MTFFKHEDIESQIKHMKILIFGNEKIALNENQVIDLFNKTFKHLELPGSHFSSNNFSFYMDTYAKVKKMS